PGGAVSVQARLGAVVCRLSTPGTATLADSPGVQAAPRGSLDRCAVRAATVSRSPTAARARALLPLRVCTARGERVLAERAARRLLSPALPGRSIFRALRAARRLAGLTAYCV